MSRVTQTELFEGDVATAANFNATLSSWNAATAGGQINGANFKEEGLDRSCFSAGSVTTTVANGAIRFRDTTFPISSWAAVNGSEIGPFPDGPVLLHASVMVRKDDIAAGFMTLRLVSSATPGGVGTVLGGTERSVYMRPATATPLTSARLDRSITICKLVTASLTARYFRVEAFNTNAGNLLVQGTIFGQVIAK